MTTVQIEEGEFTIRKKFFFKVADEDELHGVIDNLHSDYKSSKTPLAVDTKTEKTPAQLYDPDKMPEGLKAHHELDLAIERCHRSKPFTSDEERLEYLFGLYEEMMAKSG